MVANAATRVVIVGGGFGGLYAARSLKRAPVQVTLVDRRNFHLFQPLLYQVATGGLSPGEIASPLRAVLSRHGNTRVLLGEVERIDVEQRRVQLSDGAVDYDELIVATGATHHYFGNDQWEPFAPGLKTIEDATEMRRRILLAFETAEREPDPARREAWLTFVVVGAGPTGVELAGALSEIANDTLKNDFRAIHPRDSRILLVEATDRVLPAYPRDLSEKACRSLEHLGVTVRLRSSVSAIDAASVTVTHGERSEVIRSRTVLWAAGVAASPLARQLAAATGAALDRAGRVHVLPDLSLPGHPEIAVIGDMAHCEQDGALLPGIAPVAMAQGRHAARRVVARATGRAVRPFRYFDKGTMATIGRSSAVANLRLVHMSGLPAWLAWLFIHLLYLVEFENRLLVLVQWAWMYFTRNRGARLITGADPLPLPLSTPATKDAGADAGHEVA
ncbi:NAD(P)/FAD-dependent oxidoreductase [bacterium]|nr:NAD(P)/FAD-dependent oxidoreductase [bacterium]